MPLSFPIGNPPYLDDYDAQKNYYKMMFQPGVSVQTRELNQLQTLMQVQIERFGDNVFKKGTIVSGCNFIFYPTYSYVKLLDNQVDGTPVNLSTFFNTIATCNSSGLRASIINFQDGFESADPDLKTIYVNYRNSGSNTTTESFSAGDILTCSDLNNSIWGVNINNGGSGFSNTDTLVFTPRLIVNVASGAYANGDSIINQFGSNVHIIGIDSATFAAQGQQLITIRPWASDLANTTPNSNVQPLAVGQSITNQGNAVSARIEGIVGSGARGRIFTDAVGKVVSIAILSRGQGYTYAPFASIASANNGSGIGLVDLTAKNYVGQLRVASVANPTGNGYAFGVGEGVIYQKGYFIRVAPQTIIVDKYSMTPNAVSVGFSTIEQIVDYNTDPSLRDPVNNTQNQGAPGANRLQLIPQLTLTTTSNADANADFFTITSWSEGNPYQQNQVTSYNQVDDAMATRIGELDGDCVVDSFLLTTRSPIDPTYEGNTYSVIVDSGTAYISGKRIQTVTNFDIDSNKGISTKVTNNHLISLNYGNYLLLNEVGGVFQFNTGDTINLYDTKKGFISNTSLVAAGNVTPQGTLIGTARMRSMTVQSGQPGTNTALYALYLFNINMNQGKTFQSVKSVSYGATPKGIADVYLTSPASPTANANVAVMQSSNISTLIFPTGAESLKNANNLTYTYRTIDQARSVANTGIATKSVSTDPNAIFPYTGALTNQQMQDLYVVPTAIDLVFTANLTGTVSCNTTSPNVIGFTTTFVSQLQPGDFVYLFNNSSSWNVKKVISVVNNTLAILDSNATFSNGTANLTRVFPQNVPVPFGWRSGLSANVDVTQQSLTLNFGTTFAGSTSANIAIGCNVQEVGVSQVTKTPNRGYYTMLCTSNNAGGINGPWCLGVPDIFRLRGVWVGNSSVTNTGPNAVTSFYIDNNQNPDWLDLGYLYVQPKAPVSLSANSYILVEYDYFTTSAVGPVDPLSYLSSNTTTRVLVDSQPLSNLTSAVCSWEVPEGFDSQGTEYDMLEMFDFRPIASITSAPTQNPATAPLNPSSTLSFGNTVAQANEKKFPLPGSAFTSNIEEFQGHIDTVYLTPDGVFNITSGRPGPRKAISAPSIPVPSMKLSDLLVPPYPNLPIVPSTTLSQVLSTGIINSKFLTARKAKKTITKPSTPTGVPYSIPKVYTMADIGHLDRRLSDVEYYVSLNLLQANVASLAIPSSVNPALNRFKFGFFADDFTTYTFSDTSNPTYAAQIEDNAAVPEKLEWQVSLYGGVGGDDYIDFVIVQQTNATWPDTIGPVCILQHVTYNVQIINGQYYLNIPRQTITQGGGGNTQPVYIDITTAIRLNIDSGSVTGSAEGAHSGPFVYTTVAPDQVPVGTVANTAFSPITGTFSVPENNFFTY